MQLVAYGAQDVYLTGNPQITFFKVVYRRHTNFAMESIEQVFNGTTDFGRKVTCTISRNGDLIHRTYLRMLLPDVSVPAGQVFRWTNFVGHTLVKTVELEIGGMRIDKHYCDWLHIWNELTQQAGKQLGYANMVGNIPSLTNPVDVLAGAASPGFVGTGNPGTILYVPLEFWFCRNPGLALPLIALQYHEVKINIEFATLASLYFNGPSTSTANTASDPGTANAIPLVTFNPTTLTASLWVDYIYLDTDERRRFAQVSHEYLIEQLQFTGGESYTGTAPPSSSTKIKLNFNHPTKELIWVMQPDDNIDNTIAYGAQYYNYTDALDRTYNQPILGSWLNFKTSGAQAGGGANNVFTSANFGGGDNTMSTGLLQLNGHERFSTRDSRYFNLVQPYQHHENIPSKGIYVYSFGLKPEEHQPSGTCNFSRIDVAMLSLGTSLNAASKTTVAPNTTAKHNTGQVRVYAINYNVLRIMSGMGGLAYSN